MGCDMHAFMELKIDGRWECHSVIKPHRNYEMFAKLVGVRGNVEDAMFELKPLPEDLSNVVKVYVKNWEQDMHSASWLNLEELQRFEEWFNEREELRDSFNWFGREFCSLCGSIWSREKLAEHSIQDARLVFWFDN